LVVAALARPVLDLFRLEDRVAVVTGGSKGLGAAISEGLASAGADVCVVSRHGTEARAAAASIAKRTGRRVVGIEADVSNGSAVDRITETVMNEFGHVDVLVNSAAITVRGAIGEVDTSDFDQAFATNVRGTWLMCRSVLPAMREQGRGRIVNIASTSGVAGARNRSVYAGTKGAVIQITKSLALECALDGITANVLAPGPFLTEMTRPIATSEQFLRTVNQEVAMKRMGELHEIQGAALFLSSDASSYVTGTVLVVDGGLTAR
jgi:NAD(P)-dependent dehydrogenase (short-subunit alcohol dehydrogenase family)